MKTADGRDLWFRDFMHAVSGPEGKVERLRGIMVDITESKRAEEALRESQALTNAIVDSTSDMIWSVDPVSFGLLTFNRSLEDYFLKWCGIRLQIGTGPEDHFSTQDLVDRWRGLYQRALSEGPYTLDYNVTAGSSVLQLTFNLLKRDGRVFGISVFGKNITERKRAEDERQRSLEQLRALAARLQGIREEERKSVAREIHDQLGQALTAIKIDLSSLIHDLPADKKQGSESFLNLIDQTIQSVRRISTELRPGILDDLGLVAAVEWAGEEFEARTGTTCRLDLPQDDIAVDPEQATAIFRILQEALTNVARHADASDVEVRLAREDGHLTLEVHDNGKGIAGDKLSSGGSLGILGMRERAMLLGGELAISGPPRNGTTVRVRIPEARQNHQEQLK
jgi:signal transduction histidine kinase